ncbi:MAG TPA: beta-ketoacyl synthase N-terminal-like domain-containing protein [Polyangia bacterium]|nr:beta-ketoacyl synthase N-terminal-like domain-containing protein [Polyangia bacterium]
MRLHVHGAGRIALGRDEPLGAEPWRSLGRLGDVPIKQHAPPSAYRRFGRLTRLMYMAGLRAIADAGLETTDRLAVVTGTALGEVATSLELLGRIHGSKGAAVGAALVPGSVHNAPAGQLTIGLKSRGPSLTVSHGALSAEAAICAAADLIASGAAELALVVCGDEADPAWSERLDSLGATELARSLRAEAFQEGAAALVVGREPGGRRLGSLAATLERAPSLERAGALVEGITGGPVAAEARWLVRPGAGGEALAAGLAAVLGRAVICDDPGRGVAQAGALAILADALLDRQPALAVELVILGRELDDLGATHFRP